MVSLPRQRALATKEKTRGATSGPESLGYLDGVIRQLVFSVKPAAGTVAGITSAIDGEGKTTVVSELAQAIRSFAPADHPVLVIDCKQPFGGQPEPGARAMQLPQPQVMVLREATVSGALEMLRMRHAFILLDMPSLLNDPVATELARHVDHLYVVVRAGATHAALVERAVAGVREVNFAGLILNDVRTRTPAWVARLVQ